MSYLDKFIAFVKVFGVSVLATIFSDNMILRYTILSFISLVALLIVGYFIPSVILYVFLFLLLLFASLVMGVLIAYMVEIVQDVKKK